ncbi:MAG: CRTAC1 family protein [Gammaproteobacteria bacterium]
MRLVAALTLTSMISCSMESPGEPPLLEDVTSASGVDFVHDNGMRDQLWFAEMMGGGVATLDFDRDGDQDLLFTQSRALDQTPSPATLQRLYRNDSQPGALRFVDVSEQAGLRSEGYAMGVAVGDVNNDGYPDVYFTAFGKNSLWLNQTDGRFAQLDGVAADARWSVSASFADLDLDGALDLYVGNYVDYRLANHKPCRSTTSARDYCSPTVYPPQADSLWRNQGDGSGGFDDVSTIAGIGGELGGALGVIVADFDGDARQDIYVANDGTANLLWRSVGTMRFDNVAGLAGAAVNMSGAPEASMGVDAADFDADGDVDLFMTHLNRESNTLYVNDGRGYFDDRSAMTGVGNSSLAYTGFGTRWADFDADGDLDLFAANGAVTRVQAQIDAGDAYPLRQRNQFFRLTPEGYRDHSDRVSSAAPSAVSRGLAIADFDNDGAIDAVIANNHGLAQVLHNKSMPTRWFGALVLTGSGGRVAIGAQVTVRSGESQRVRQVRRDGSYASSSDPRVVFASPGENFSVEVLWPDGRRKRFDELGANRYHTLLPDPSP